MTEREAQWVCQMAVYEYGDQVETSMETTRRGASSYRVHLVHRVIGRHLALVNIEDWSSIREAWSAALEGAYL